MKIISKSAQTKVATKQDSVLFLFTLSLGFLVIWYFNATGKPVDARNITDLAVRVGLPCFLLLVYALIVWFIPKFRLNSEQAGDNCYYLGFVFTLISLAFALYDFVLGSDRTLIVQDFGIALSTTIVGLVFRVLFNQSRLDRDHVEIEVRESLTGSARELRKELDRVVIDFNYFERTLQQSMRDTFLENKDLVSGLHSQLAEHHENIEKELLNRIKESNEKFSQLQNQVADKHVQMSEDLSENFKAINADFLEIHSKLGNQYAQITEKLSSAIEKSNDSIEKLNSNFEKSNRELVEFQEQLLVNSNKSIQVLVTFVEGMNDTLESMQRPRDEAEKLAGSVKSLNEQLTKLNEVLDESMLESLAKLKIQAQETRKEIIAGKEPFDKSIKSMKKISEELSGLESNLTELANSNKNSYSGQKRSKFRFWPRSS